jgi:CheY-like chemotaxis protein
MSESMPILPVAEAAEKRTPTVYFIDDSATMREVIKIAFRRENIQVITCADAASALSQFEENPPDAVITDVIMPDQDGYSVCNEIKQHSQFGNTPVILMSGVVNKSVADKAVSVKADELIRKPFQPQELIARVKSLLEPKPSADETPADSTAGISPLSSLFAPQAASAPPPPFSVPQPYHGAGTKTPPTAWPGALAEAFGSKAPSANPAAAAAPPPRPASAGADVQRLRAEIMRLELLVKKLQTELQIERQYNQALELHARALAGISGD